MALSSFKGYSLYLTPHKTVGHTHLPPPQGPHHHNQHLLTGVSYQTSADQDIPSDLFSSAGSLASHPSTDFCCDLVIYPQYDLFACKSNSPVSWICKFVHCGFLRTQNKAFVRYASSVSAFHLHRDLVYRFRFLGFLKHCHILWSNFHRGYNFIRFLKMSNPFPQEVVVESPHPEFHTQSCPLASSRVYPCTVSRCSAKFLSAATKSTTDSPSLRNRLLNLNLSTICDGCEARWS